MEWHTSQLGLKNNLTCGLNGYHDPLHRLYLNIYKIYPKDTQLSFSILVFL